MLSLIIKTLMDFTRILKKKKLNQVQKFSLCFLIGYRRFRNFILYCLIGCSGCLIDFLLFVLFTKYLNVHYMLANILSVSFGIINNFFLNYYLNFKTRDNMTLRMLSFYGVGIIGLLCSNGLLFLLVQTIGFSHITSKLATILIVTLIQFGLNKTISFKEIK